MSQTSSRAGSRPGFRPVTDRFELSRHIEVACRDSSNLVADRFTAGLQPARELVADQL